MKLNYHLSGNSLLIVLTKSLPLHLLLDLFLNFYEDAEIRFFLSPLVHGSMLYMGMPCHP